MTWPKHGMTFSKSTLPKAKTTHRQHLWLINGKEGKKQLPLTNTIPHASMEIGLYFVTAFNLLLTSEAKKLRKSSSVGLLHPLNKDK